MAKKKSKKKTAKKKSKRAAAPASKAPKPKKPARPRAVEAPVEPPRSEPPPPSKQRERSRELSRALALALDETNCHDIIVLDLFGLSQVWDFLVVGSGTSERQMRTAIDRAEETAKGFGERPFGGFRDRSPTWMALDFIDVAVHVFEPSTRSTYDLELLWGDAPRVEWADGKPRRAAAARRAGGA